MSMNTQAGQGFGTHHTNLNLDNKHNKQNQGVEKIQGKGYLKNNEQDTHDDGHHGSHHGHH